MIDTYNQMIRFIGSDINMRHGLTGVPKVEFFNDYLAAKLLRRQCEAINHKIVFYEDCHWEVHEWDYDIAQVKVTGNKLTQNQLSEVIEKLNELISLYHSVYQ